MYSYQKASINEINEFLMTYSQEEIFKLVFGEYPSLDKSYISPFRIDNNPACYFSWYNNMLYFIDWASDIKHRTCIQAVKEYFKLPNLLTTLHFVQNNISNNNHSKQPEYSLTINTTNKKTKSYVKIIPIKRDFEKRDFIYWNQFGITKEQLIDDKVFSVSAINMIKNNQWKRFNYFDIAYCYTLDKDIYKIYRPYQKGKSKWLTNANENIIGDVSKLKYKSDTLIITKSYKDSRVIRNLGYESIWFQNERVIPSNDLLNELIFTYKKIVILFDNDKTGIIASKNLKKILEALDTNKIITTIVSPDNYIKDISEMYCYQSKEKAINFLKQNT